LKISNAYYHFILMYSSMKLCVLMKNYVFHKHEKFDWRSVRKKREIGIWNIYLSLRLSWSFMNAAPGLEFTNPFSDSILYIYFLLASANIVEAGFILYSLSLRIGLYGKVFAPCLGSLNCLCGLYYFVPQDLLIYWLCWCV